jgi:hypothetical protein
MKCTHYDSMVLYLEDARETDTPWERWECRIKEDTQRRWTICVQHPTWDRRLEYRRRIRTITIGDVTDVPAPLKTPPPLGTTCWLVLMHDESTVLQFDWGVAGDLRYTRWLERGLVHDNESAARDHARALIQVSTAEPRHND